jgi:hypothetical protein
MKTWKARRRPFLLLEVMIAFGILSLAAIPLIYPHLMILKEERALIQEMNIDFIAKEMIADFLVDLYDNKTPITLIESKGTQEAPPNPLFEKAFFEIDERHKPQKPDDYVLYKVEAKLTIITKTKTAVYPFNFIIERFLKNDS